MDYAPAAIDVADGRRLRSDACVTCWSLGCDAKLLRAANERGGPSAEFSRMRMVGNQILTTCTLCTKLART